VAAQLAASQEGPGSMELVSYAYGIMSVCVYMCTCDHGTEYLIFIKLSNAVTQHYIFSILRALLNNKLKKKNTVTIFYLFLFV
jgi:hypothetical protein